MKSKEVETIIFDVDGTLSDEVSWLKLTDGLGASSKTHKQIFAKFKSGKLSYSKAKHKLILLWQNTKNANKPYMKKMFHSWRLKEDAHEIINYLKRSYRICLISGAVDLYIRVVAEKLGVVDWYANTELVWDESGNLVDFHYFTNQSQKKIKHLNKYVAKYDLDINRCAVVGDGDSDIALFKKLPYGIAVNKNSYPELEILATKTVSRLSQLKDFF